MKPELRIWSHGERIGQQASTFAVVFVHGIFSSHETFNTFHDQIRRDVRFRAFDVFYYDYDFYDALEANGKLFAQALKAVFRADDTVIIIAHSMGGLVARIAILFEQLSFIRCLFLLGTPNLGAIRIAQLSLLTQLIQRTVNTTFAVFPRKEGIVDLTRAGEILYDLQRNSEHADHIDYVTIPGLFYHEAQSVWDFGRGLAAKIFSAFRLGLGVLETMFPPLAVRLSTPHDGIVEMASNNLIPALAGRESEKKDSINLQDSTPVTYAHVETTSGRRLTHIDVQNDSDIFEVIAEIVFTSSTPVAVGPLGSRLLRWRAGFVGQSRRRIMRAITGP
jgi:pimeloyl-ACP methyl ester carboxylesterase